MKSITETPPADSGTVFKMTLDGTLTTVYNFCVTSGCPDGVGLYEFYTKVPEGPADGDYQINVTQDGTALPQTFFLTVKN